MPKIYRVVTVATVIAEIEAVDQTTALEEASDLLTCYVAEKWSGTDRAKIEINHVHEIKSVEGIE